MPDQRTPFSRRHGYVADATLITVREDATEDLRYAVAQSAVEVGVSPSPLRNIVCRVLLTRPDQSNWSEYPNIWDEVQSLLADCPWHKVYDIAEAVHNALATNNPEAGQAYESSLNDFVRERGIGWEMRDGEFIARGSEGFSAATSEAAQTLADEGRNTAARELHEALHDLSRRPEPDITGSIQHAMAAVECVARDVAGTPNLTLGDVINRHAASLNIRPPPCDVPDRHEKN